MIVVEIGGVQFSPEKSEDCGSCAGSQPDAQESLCGRLPPCVTDEIFKAGTQALKDFSGNSAVIWLKVSP